MGSWEATHTEGTTRDWWSLLLYQELKPGPRQKERASENTQLGQSKKGSSMDTILPRMAVAL